jgi:hypothetical protein
MDAHGTCFVGVRKLADDMRVDVRTVKERRYGHSKHLAAAPTGDAHVTEG